MTPDEYQITQDTMTNIYQQLALYNLKIGEFLTEIRRMDTVGPILDPTAWIKGRDNLETIKRMAEALRPAVDLVRTLREEVGHG